MPARSCRQDVEASQQILSIASTGQRHLECKGFPYTPKKLGRDGEDTKAQDRP